jgi:hypothetical protein
MADIFGIFGRIWESIMDKPFIDEPEDDDFCKEYADRLILTEPYSDERYAIMAEFEERINGD